MSYSCQVQANALCATGLLKTARYLEPMAMLWIHLAYNQGFGTDFAFKLIRRSGKS